MKTIDSCKQLQMKHKQDARNGKRAEPKTENEQQKQALEAEQMTYEDKFSKYMLKNTRQLKQKIHDEKERAKNERNRLKFEGDFSVCLTDIYRQCRCQQNLQILIVNLQIQNICSNSDLSNLTQASMLRLLFIINQQLYLKYIIFIHCPRFIEIYYFIVSVQQRLTGIVVQHWNHCYVIQCKLYLFPNYISIYYSHKLVNKQNSKQQDFCNLYYANSVGLMHIIKNSTMQIFYIVGLCPIEKSLNITKVKLQQFSNIFDSNTNFTINNGNIQHIQHFNKLSYSLVHCMLLIKYFLHILYFTKYY
ncbi:Hypothetical_protein [Hexamita inflata]|uniref:Hypothetical_protein n=1 Tax=Hexamita inflata TaxID=28002 RepID=A0AA86UZJ7_9EUKA|nr:Hypothetical protein HINF_LOCUS66150 [Hexamita inflata]